MIYVGEYTKAMNKTWHINHFCCWQCDTPLTAKKYIIINEHPFCQNCYNTVIANTCHICQTAIGPESKDLYVKDRHFHDTCLACVLCQERLVGFFQNPTVSSSDSYCILKNRGYVKLRKNKHKCISTIMKLNGF